MCVNNDAHTSVASLLAVDTFRNYKMQGTRKTINPLGLLSDVVDLRATYDDPVEKDVDWCESSVHEKEDHVSDMEEEQEQEKKHVKFHTTVEINPLESPLDVLYRLGIPFDSLFYAIEELMIIYNREVDALFTEAYSPSGRASGNVRGFEFRSSRERQRRCRLGNQMVIQQQNRLSADRLAELSLRCSQWASTVAQKAGTLDFVHVYVDVNRLPSESLIAIARMQREVLDPSLIQEQPPMEA